MCGINGIISTEKSFNLTEDLLKMNLEITHRGPDDDGVFLNEENEYKVGFSMRRLSIIDLKFGKQPIYTKDEKKVIVFNGEIYNYQYLKDKHLNDYIFKTNSDTEVILALYEKYGADSFSLLDGMFSFSIYDSNKKEVFIVRDFFGEKPLYYFFENGTFYWASELKSIIKVIRKKPILSKQGLNLFFKLSYIPAPYTIYKNIFKLKANHFIKFDCLSMTYNEIEVTQKHLPQNYSLDIKTAVEINHQLVQDSVRSRSISDVPIGSFLSGGVDSSIVSLCMSMQSSRKIQTFSIGFDNKNFDETSKARTVSKIINSDHHEFIISENDLKSNLDQIILNFDEPFADSSALPTFAVSKLAKHFVKVTLTGDGGDEVYGGYNKYYIGKLNNIYSNLIPQKLHKRLLNIINDNFLITEDNRGFYFKLRRFLSSINYEDDFYYNIISLAFQDSERSKILKEEYFIEDVINFYKNYLYNKSKTLSDFRAIDKLVSLEGDMLVKVDRTSMLASLECRSPFLNKEIWNFTNSLPENYLIKGWNKKFLLKESFKKYFPPGFLDHPKKGFGIPIGEWLRRSLKKELLSYVDKDFILKQNIFNYDEIYIIVMNHIDNKVDNSFNVYSFYCFQKWYINSYDI